MAGNKTCRKNVLLTLALGKLASSEGWVSTTLPKVDLATQSTRRHRVARPSAELSDSEASRLVAKLGLAVTPSPPPPLVVPTGDASAEVKSSDGFPDLTRVPHLDAATLLEFERNGHIVTRELFSAADMEKFDGPVRSAFELREFEAWVHSCRVMLGDENCVDDFGLSMFETVDECRDALMSHDVELPFLQVFNTWQHDAAVAAIAKSPRLAATAAKLLNVPRVRLYQDSMFLKRVGDGATRWHSDLHMAPFDTNGMVTVWIPLDAVPHADDGGTGLCFATGSHRDFALPFWSRPHEGGADFSARYEDKLSTPVALAVGDATWHHGWTLHSAPPNDPWFGLPEDCGEAVEDAAVANAKPRLALTVSFIADGARLQAKASASATGDDDDDNNNSGNGELGFRDEFEDEDVVDDNEAKEKEEDGRKEINKALEHSTMVKMDDEDRSSYEGWLKNLAPGAVADHPSLPIVWDSDRQCSSKL